MAAMNNYRKMEWKLEMENGTDHESVALSRNFFNKLRQWWRWQVRGMDALR